MQIGKNYQLLLSFTLFILFDSIATHYITGCVFHENVYFRYEQQNNIMTFRLQTREGKGESEKQKTKNLGPWSYVGFGKDFINNSISILNVYPSTAYQLQTNLSETVRGNESYAFDPSVSFVDELDRMFTLYFNIEMKDLINQTFVWFSRGDDPLESRKYSLEEFIQKKSFVTKIYPILTHEFTTCLRIGSVRVDSSNFIFFISTLIFYIIILFLLILFRNEEPLRSRSLGPFIGLICQFICLIGNHLITNTTLEFKNQYGCYVFIFCSLMMMELSFLIPCLIYFRSFLINNINEYKEEFYVESALPNKNKIKNTMKIISSGIISKKQDEEDDEEEESNDEREEKEEIGFAIFHIFCYFSLFIDHHFIEIFDIVTREFQLQWEYIAYFEYCTFDYCGNCGVFNIFIANL
eukprot:gene10099-2519_t